MAWASLKTPCLVSKDQVVAKVLLDTGAEGSYSHNPHLVSIHLFGSCYLVVEVWFRSCVASSDASQYDDGWPQAPIHPPVPVSHVLGLQACAITPGL